MNTNIDHPLLAGVVGSTAYGLAHEGSDVDRLGVFAYPTERFFGLEKPKESLVRTEPDETWHEAAKAVKLILAANPTVMEILWLESYEVSTPLGLELVALRSSLLSAKAVRNAYLGYATQQFRKLVAREVTGTAAPSRTQSAKHARHLYRLLLQGSQLHRTGELMIRLDDPEHVRNWAEECVRAPVIGELLIKDVEKVFDGPGVLPEAPDTSAAAGWLLKVREAFYMPSKSCVQPSGGVRIIR